MAERRFTHRIGTKQWRVDIGSVNPTALLASNRCEPALPQRPLLEKPCSDGRYVFGVLMDSDDVADARDAINNCRREDVPNTFKSLSRDCFLAS